jgi:aryl-alcohol dehydrogenase-like predicted oxidoreductase
MGLTGSGTWGEPRDPDAARALLRLAREVGVQFLDTADSYGPGVSERLIQEVHHPYPDVLVATKGGHTRQGPSRWARDGRPEHLRSACESSLERLAVDCIDLYQLHAVDPQVPIEESIGALVELRDEGKIRHIGVCNVTVAELERALAVTEVVSVQNRFSLADRGAQPVLDLCDERGIVFIPWAPLGGGTLADARGELARIAERRGSSPSQIALAWLLHRSPLMLPIPGTRSAAHLEEDARSLLVDLDGDELAALERPVKVPLTRKRVAREVRGRLRRMRRALHA